jgi:hypothetical protein
MHSRRDVDSKKKSHTRDLVAFMNLFAGGFALDEAAQDFRDQVLSLATQIAANVHAFFDEHGVRADRPALLSKPFASYTAQENSAASWSTTRSECVPISLSTPRHPPVAAFCSRSIPRERQAGSR